MTNDVKQMLKGTMLVCGLLREELANGKDINTILDEIETKASADLSEDDRTQLKIVELISSIRSL